MKTSNSHPQPHHNRHRRHRSQRHWSSVLAALVLVGGLAMTGCSPSDNPPNAASAPATTGITAPPVPSQAPTKFPRPVYKPATANGPAQNVPVPVLPTKAKEFSKAGLEAFATYWYSTLGYVFETGDSTPMMAVTEKGCTTCANINAPVGKWYQSGGWIIGGRMTIHSATTTFAKAPDGKYQVILLSQQSPIAYYKSDGSLKHAYPPVKAQADIFIASYDAGTWTAHTVEKLSGAKS